MADQRSFGKKMKPRWQWVDEPNKDQLHELADALLLGEAGAKEAAIAFFAQDSEGIWHNRARAMIARRVKKISIEKNEKRSLVEAVQRRLTEGKISEQFRDQLRMALFFDRSGTVSCAQSSLTSAKPHVVRFAQWVLNQTKTEPNQPLPRNASTGSVSNFESPARRR